MGTISGGPVGRIGGAAIGATAAKISPGYVNRLNALYRNSSAAYSDPVLLSKERAGVLRGALIAAAILLTIFTILWFMPY